jgi:integrase
MATESPNDAPTVREIVSLYLADLTLRCAAGNYSRQSVQRAQYYLTSFAAMFGDQAEAQCTQQDLTKWLLVNPTWRSNHTKGDALGVLVSCFNWACDPAKITQHPIYRRPKALHLKRTPRQPASRADYCAIMRAAMFRVGSKGRLKCGSRVLRLAIFFLRRTGVRTKEMRTARFEQIDWAIGVMRQRDHKTFHVTGEERVIGLDRCVLRLLRNLYSRRRPSQEYIFTNKRRRPWTKDSFSRHFRAYAKRAGLRSGVSGYCLRHSFCTEGILAGIGDRQLADQMGHTTTKLIAWYARRAKQNSHYLRRVADDVNRNRNRDYDST